MRVLYFSPALCGESFCPAKQTTHTPASRAPLHHKVRPQNLYQITRATVADVFYRRKQNASALAPAALYAAHTLGIAQLFAYQRNELLSLRIDEADRLLVGVTKFEEVIGNVESG